MCRINIVDTRAGAVRARQAANEDRKQWGGSRPDTQGKGKTTLESGQESKSERDCVKMTVRRRDYGKCPTLAGIRLPFTCQPQVCGKGAAKTPPCNLAR